MKPLWQERTWQEIRPLRLEIIKQDVLGIKWQDHVESQVNQGIYLSESNEVFKEGLT